MSDQDLGRLKIEKKSAASVKPIRRNRFLILAVTVFILLATAGSYIFIFPVMTVETATVSRIYPSQGVTILNASGYVVAQRKAAVAPKTTGQLEWLGVEEGSRVKGGQLMARLENRDAVAARDHAVASVAMARAELEQARAELLDAERSYARISDLVSSGVMAKADLDSAEARLNRSRGAVRAMEYSIKSAQATLASADASIEYTNIRAPFDAVVLTKNADVGDIITPIGSAANAKAAVVTIADLSSIQVEADVSEGSLSKVKAGQPCEIQLDALPDLRFRGVLHAIVPTADRSKASVMVKVRFLESNPGILPEMSAKVAFLQRELTSLEKRPRTSLPVDTIVESGGRKTVFVMENDHVREVPVTLGMKLGDYTEVLEGVKPGDVVVRKPAAKLKSGARVKMAGQK